MRKILQLLQNKTNTRKVKILKKPPHGKLMTQKKIRNNFKELLINTNN